MGISEVGGVHRELIRMVGTIRDENPVRSDGLEKGEIVDSNR